MTEEPRVPTSVTQGQSGLAEMVALDEEIEAEYPGWMSGIPADIDAVIAQAFAGHGVAIRAENDPPIPGEPFMSMAVAKDICRGLLLDAPSKSTPVAGSMGDEQFIREERYIVIKRKHLTDDAETAILAITDAFDVEELDCVVVEKGWPEYEPVWRMIEERCAQEKSNG